MTQQQFNQVYTKLINSIEKSLEDFNSPERIYWEKTRAKSKAKALKQAQIDTEKTDEIELFFE